MRHSLKIKEQYLENLLLGIKKSEIRYNDRDYQKGDVLEFIDSNSVECPREVIFEITHIHSGLGMADGYVSLSVVKINTD